MDVVFDFAGVLFAWRPRELVAYVFPELACTSKSAKELALSVFAHPDWMDFDRGMVDSKRISVATAQRLSLDLQQVTALVDSVVEKMVPMPDSLAILRNLHVQKHTGGSPVSGLYYLSNMPEPFARMLEQRHDFLSWFDGGIFSGDGQLIKPELAIFDLLQTRYALNPATIIFIDDMPYNVEAARALGWKAIHFTSAVNLRAELAALITIFSAIPSAPSQPRTPA
jgi:putative hydrolase of the HAD superfamily